MASMCQPETNGVDGSTTGQANRTKSPSLRVANSESISSSREGLVSKGAKLLEFVIGQLRQIRFGCDLDRATGQTAVLGVYDVTVTKQVLGEENGSRDVAGACQPKQTPANRDPALCLRAIHN